MIELTDDDADEIIDLCRDRQSKSDSMSVPNRTELVIVKGSIKFFFG